MIESLYGAQNLVLLALGLAALAMEAVSYTHLDVYKRQSRVMQLSIRAKDQDEMNETLAEYNRSTTDASSGTTQLGALLREQLGKSE